VLSRTGNANFSAVMPVPGISTSGNLNLTEAAMTSLGLPFSTITKAVKHPIRLFPPTDALWHSSPQKQLTLPE